MNIFKKGAVTKQDLIICGIILAVAVLIGAGYFFLLRPSWQTQITQLEATITAKKQELDNAQRKAARKDLLDEELAKVEAVVDVFEDRLPDERELAELAEYFEEAAIETQLAIEKISALPDIKSSTLIQIPYSVAVSGNYHQIARFINQLERGDRFFKITDLYIEEQEDGASPASFTVTTYQFVKAEEGAPAGAQS